MPLYNLYIGLIRLLPFNRRHRFCLVETERRQVTFQILHDGRLGVRPTVDRTHYVVPVSSVVVGGCHDYPTVISSPIISLKIRTNVAAPVEMAAIVPSKNAAPVAWITLAASVAISYPLSLPLRYSTLCCSSTLTLHFSHADLFSELLPYR